MNRLLPLIAILFFACAQKKERVITKVSPVTKSMDSIIASEVPIDSVSQLPQQKPDKRCSYFIGWIGKFDNYSYEYWGSCFVFDSVPHGLDAIKKEIRKQYPKEVKRYRSFAVISIHKFSREEIDAWNDQ
jgi:hypothetical protein